MDKIYISQIAIGNSTYDIKDAEARSLIEYLHKVAVTGDYNDLSNKPDLSGMIETTYSNLVSLRNNSQLIPGKWYRITDYQCTTTQANTQSANHPFDIIVRADSVNVLNENAYAALHAGDTYFANSNLAAWELKYCIDNDTDRFAWAMAKSEGEIVTANGTFPYVGEETIDGITYQKWKPATPLFTIFEYVYTKNGSSTVYGLYNGHISDLEFSYTAIIQPSEDEGCGVIYWMRDEFNNECPYDFKNILFSIDGNYYTFNVVVSGVMTDHSLNGAYCFENKIKEYKINNTQNLNRIVFKNTNKANGCSSNIFGDNCYSNTFSNNCSNNIFGNSCYSNTFSNNCSSNIFGKNFRSNVFGTHCLYNTFGKDSVFNRFGDSCSYNTFSNNCSNNIFGNSCYSNTFGNSCDSNAFNNNCYYNTFGNSCSNNTFGKDNTKYVIIENGNINITLASTATTSSASPLRNIKIAQGVNNTTTDKTILHNTLSDTFLTEYKPANSQTILI